MQLKKYCSCLQKKYHLSKSYLASVYFMTVEVCNSLPKRSRLLVLYVWEIVNENCTYQLNG